MKTAPAIVDEVSPVLGAARRDFLRVSAATGGGLLLAIALPVARAQAAVASPAALQPNAFIRIHREGQVTLVMHKAEMGQGVFTALAQLLAEELEVPVGQVLLEQAPPDDARYGEPFFGGLQMTGGSTSIRSAWLPLRQAGATARELLVQAAATTWRVPDAGLVARDGKVFDPSGGKSLSYGALVDVAATLPVPQGVALKAPQDFRVIGKPLRRLDGRSKVDGKATFGMDVMLAGMKIAAVAICPEFGGTLAGVDSRAAMKLAGVRQVVALGSAVAVVADNFWAAQQGLLAAAPRWKAGANPTLDSAQLAAQLDEAAQRFAAGAGAVAAARGDAPAALARAAQRLEAVYRAPFLAHMAMEPLNCTVAIRGGKVDLFVGTQVPTRARDAAARAAGVGPAQVTVHNQLIGGAFGRRLEVDFIELAVSVAKQVHNPVKVVWSREEDVQHDMYRPCYHDTLEAGLDAAGMPVAWTHRIAASSILARFLPPGFRDGVDGDAVEGATETPYAFPALRVEFQRVEPPGIPTAFWRGVGPTHNAFVVEGFIDELAATAGRDPLDYRRALVRDPRARAVLDLAAAKAGWGTPVPKGQGRGIALLQAFGSYVAQVIQVQVGDDGDVRVLRVVCAVDCGQVVNPSTVAAQMEGGIVFGLSAALWGEITFAEGRVEQSNFHDYRVMRLNEVPRIDVHIVPSSEAPGGVGEPGTSVAIPALVNAVHAATGRRIRTLPIASQLASPLATQPRKEPS
jgi:isoquinoline 1-oxidoreductase subunit beta